MDQIPLTAPGVQLSRWQEAGVLEVSRIEGAGATEFYVCVRPDAGGDIKAQVRQVYQRFGRLICDQGVGRSAVVSERMYLKDMQQVEVLQGVRAEFYDKSAGPATTYLQQPPCSDGVELELQARVVFAATAEQDVRVVCHPADLGAGAARQVSCAGFDHFYLHNVTGGVSGDGADYAAQMEQVFDCAESFLESQGMTFRDVIRTWLYLSDMERDYDDLNRVRSRFFDRVGVHDVPASTGIQGGVYPGDRSGSMDLYAMRASSAFDKRQMHAKTLNEAWSYGSAFCRGMEVTREDRTVLYVSGTASIDENGQIVSVGDIDGQVERMLSNVEALLAGSHATPADLVRATTYLKEPAYRQVFERGWRGRGFPLQIPHTVCVADVCRPDWLCETEVVAVTEPR